MSLSRLSRDVPAQCCIKLRDRERLQALDQKIIERMGANASVRLLLNHRMIEENQAGIKWKT